MRPFYLILPFILACSQVPKHSATGGPKQNDTIFLKREKTHDFYHKVYIERNRSSKEYQRVLDFKMDSMDLADAKENYGAVKEQHPTPFKHYDLGSLPKEWMPLYSYKGKHYIYHPSEMGSLGRKIITDSTMVYWFGDGIAAQPYIAVNRLSERTWQFKIKPLYASDKPEVTVTLFIIDPEKGIALWDDPTLGNNNDRYRLYVARDKAANFDMVVNECLQNKTDEFEFDKIDYQKLLQKVK